MGFPRARGIGPWTASGAVVELTVVIPALNESSVLPLCLDSVREQAPGPAEIIVVDGGSTDGTARSAEAAGARVVFSERGRGAQLHAGALASRSRNLLFLHADTRLPPGALALVDRALRRPGVEGGRFRVRFEHRHVVLKLIELLSRLAWIPSGDSALFVSRRTYLRIGGFENVPLFEDMRFFRRLRNAGRVQILSASVTTSCRRFCRRGPFRQLVLNTVLVLAHRLGVHPRTLAAWYGSAQGHTGGPPCSHHRGGSR
jgi:rSAM/selenodomain-associated transferase 2